MNRLIVADLLPSKSHHLKGELHNEPRTIRVEFAVLNVKQKQHDCKNVCAEFTHTTESFDTQMFRYRIFFLVRKLEIN